MRHLLRKETTGHIPYSPVEQLTDEALFVQLSSMENASDLNPRKLALRQERIGRRITELGLREAEELLGINIENEGLNG